MSNPIQIDVEKLKSQRVLYVSRIAAIDKVLEGVAELTGILAQVGIEQSTPDAATPELDHQHITGQQTNKPNARVRRTRDEVDAIKQATLLESTAKAGTKVEIFSRLVDAGHVTDSRKDSELVLRTLKDFVKEGVLFQALGGVFTSDPAGQAVSPRTAEELERRGIYTK